MHGLGPKGISNPLLFKSLAFILMVNVLANDGRGLLIGFYVKNRFGEALLLLLSTYVPTCLQACVWLLCGRLPLVSLA